MNNFFNSLKKWFLLGALIALLLLFFYFDLYRYLTLESLQQYESMAEQWTTDHYFSTVAIYMLIYIALIACAIPCATILTVIGGFLFGMIALLYSLLCMTIGGLILFLAIRLSIGHHIANKSNGWIKNMEKGFQENAFHYLLMLRLVPVFPCWISNASAGALNVPLKTFLLATLLGLLPSTLIYVLAGRSLDKLLLIDQVSPLDRIMSPPVFLPLIGLAILSLFPVFYKYLKKRGIKS